MKPLLATACILLAPLVGAACNGQQIPPGEPPAETTPVTPRPIPIEASYTGIEEPLRTLVRGQREWEDLWSRLAANRIPRPAPPPVDFSEEVVVVAAMGTRPSGGYAIRIDSLRYAKDTLWVDVTSLIPGPSCLTTQALTAPVAAVAVERRPNVTARFVDREEARSCD